jgi:hypothetical protein
MYTDPVARKIAAEQQTAAAPTPGELPQHPNGAECHVDECDESDPTELTKQRPVDHNCPEHEPRPPTPQIVCDQHRESVSDRRQTLLQEQATSRDCLIIQYDCDFWVATTDSLAIQPGSDRDMIQIDPTTSDSDSIPQHCRCGADIKYIYSPLA